MVSTCCFVRESMCVFGGPTYFADKINTGTTHVLQIVVKISEKIKIFVQKFKVVVTGPLTRNGGMAENHGAPEPGQLHSVWTRGRTETESRQRVSGAKSP